MGLTERQRKVLDAIEKAIAANGYSPTIREIGEACGLPNNTGVLRHLEALQKKGFLRREPRIARSIRLIEQP